MTKKILITLGTLTILVLAVGATVAFTQAPEFVTQTLATGDVSQALGFGRGRHPGGHGLLGGSINMDALLAEELGITVEELQAARDRAHTAAIEQALDEGLITEDEAELMLAAQALKDYLDRGALMAEALGISVDELEEALADGTRLPDLIEELGLDPAEVRENMQAVREAAIAEAVEDGIISQDVADQILSGEGFGFGRFGGPGRHGGPGWGGFGPRPDAPDAGQADPTGADA